MIPNIVFIGLRFLFVALLYVFVILVVRAIYKDIREPDAAVRRARRKKKIEPQLVVITADRNVGARYALEGEVSIGRSPKSNVIIDDTYASQEHARIYAGSNGSFCVEDLGSTNGTYVNGRRISYAWELRAGDRIKIGKTVFEFRV